MSGHFGGLLAASLIESARNLQRALCGVNTGCRIFQRQFAEMGQAAWMIAFLA
jgi:hypothetical protein